MLKTIAKLPLLHFILLGIGLFILYYYVNPGTSKPQSSVVVQVGEDELLQFMQYRNQNANLDELRQRLRTMPDDEVDALVDDYVLQEVYYREAAFLGLGEDNMTVKQAMAKEFEDLIRRGFEKAAGDRTGEERERFIEDCMANAAGEIMRSYIVRVELEDAPSAVASRKENE